jgi:hypothetical protein
MLSTIATLLLMQLAILDISVAICRSGEPSLSTRATTGVCALQNSGCCTTANDTSLSAQLAAYGTDVSTACRNSLRQIWCVQCDQDAAMAYTTPNPNAIPRLCQIECQPIYDNCRSDVVTNPPWGGSGTLASRFATWNAFCESIGSADGSTCATFSRGIFPKTVIFKSGEPWKYLVSSTAAGFEQDTFDDSAFTSGNSPLGFDAANASAPFGTKLPTSARTTVFRKFVNFVAGVYARLVRGYLRVASDNGAAVYFNGKLLGSDDTSSHAGANWNSEFVIDMTDIKSGINLIAVRVANNDANALYFDAEMVYVSTFVPYIAATTTTQLTPAPNPPPIATTRSTTPIMTMSTWSTAGPSKEPHCPAPLIASRTSPCTATCSFSCSNSAYYVSCTLSYEPLAMEWTMQCGNVQPIAPVPPMTKPTTQMAFCPPELGSLSPDNVLCVSDGPCAFTCSNATTLADCALSYTTQWQVQCGNVRLFPMKTLTLPLAVTVTTIARPPILESSTATAETTGINGTTFGIVAGVIIAALVLANIGCVAFIIYRRRQRLKAQPVNDDQQSFSVAPQAVAQAAPSSNTLSHYSNVNVEMVTTRNSTYGALLTSEL